MKPSLLFPILAFIHQAVASNPSALSYDPNTAKDCVDWYDNAFGKSCEYVRDYYTITPEQFHQWNPSIGLDCAPWLIASYCIVTRQRMIDAGKWPTSSSTIDVAPTTTSTTTSLGPSPTVWTDRGCYADNSSDPILAKKMSADEGDARLTISSCKDMCYNAAFRFAGLENGNQCWCSPYIGGEWTKDQNDCNIPCTGDQITICGGKNLLKVFQAERNTDLASSSISTASTSSTSSTSRKDAAVVTGTIKSPNARSGAVRNIALF